MNNREKPTQRALEPVMVELRKRSTQPTEQLEAVRELHLYEGQGEVTFAGGGKTFKDTPPGLGLTGSGYVSLNKDGTFTPVVIHSIAWGLQQDTSLTLPEQRIAQALGLVALHMRLGAMNTARAYLSVLATDLRVAKPSPAVARAQDLYFALCDVVFYGLHC